MRELSDLNKELYGLKLAAARDLLRSAEDLPVALRTKLLDTVAEECLTVSALVKAVQAKGRNDLA